MSIYVLDTDHISLHQRKHPSLLGRLDAVPKKDIVVTAISVEEQVRGRFAYLNRKGVDLTFAYKLLVTTIDYFCEFEILPFSNHAQDLYRDFRQQKIRIGKLDLRIAAIAVDQKAVLLTRNRQDFERVPGLNFEDWSS